jgi:hypothetical protein
VTIDTSLLAGLPGLIALIVCLRKGPERALLNVYLPVLLLLPDGYRMSISGELSFSESAILPIAVFCLWDGWRDWQWSVTDFLVLAFVSLVSISEYLHTDYWTAQNLALRMITTIVLPYVIAKGLIVREHMGVEIAKRIVILATFVAIVSVYEFRMTADPFDALVSPLFSRIAEVPSFRYGFARIRGPWEHPILAGIILALAYRTARWLEWTHNWPGNMPFLPISKLRFCEMALIAGSVMTFSRGPWIGAAIAAVIVMLLRSRHRTYVTALAVFAVFILAIPAYNSFDAYVNVNRSRIRDEAQDSAAYRREMIQQYIVIAEERPNWGWGESRDGKALHPLINGMTSIDNHYLLLALNFGFYALASMILILLWIPVRLLVFGVGQSRDDPITSLAVTMTGIFILFAISISTAWLGAQTQPLLFLITGWSEALLLARLPTLVRTVAYQFERVMA